MATPRNQGASFFDKVTMQVHEDQKTGQEDEEARQAVRHSND
jgi:hypothetical protein